MFIFAKQILIIKNTRLCQQQLKKWFQQDFTTKKQ